MENIQVAIAILCVIAIVLLVVFAFCNAFEFLTWIAAWIRSTTEEKIGLTRAKGHYNANGYLVHSDSDIHLDATGSFKRFDSVDKDFTITVATTNLSADWNLEKEEVSIPPQPLRPAPVPISASLEIKSIISSAPPTIKQFSKDDFYEKTSISPIPRPVSSLNMTTLMQSQQFPVCLTPPPSPAVNAPQPSPKFNTFSQQQQQQQQAEGGSSSTADEGEVMMSSTIKRALSCDSVCSDTSVALGDLEEPNITGYLCVGLEYDSECCELVTNILEAKDLAGPTSADGYQMDSYVRVVMLPDKAVHAQTKIYKSSNSPSYKERILFELYPREQSQKALCFQIYGTDGLSHTLIGEGDIRLSDVSLRQPVTTWVTLTDTGQRGTEFGELMFSLSYLPTAERLTVVVVKARNLRFQNDKVVGDPFVKVYLMHQGKKIHKKKTSTKKAERGPIFNEAMIFSVPAHTLSTIQLRLTVAEAPTSENSKAYAIGHVIVGAQATGRSYNHWCQMLTALRKPVAMWHPLRK